MRIWDIHPKYLCRKHLLAEHRELHGLWNILIKYGGKGGYSHHPETKRWIGKTLALYNRHELLIVEFFRRGYRHLTPLNKKYAAGKNNQDFFIDNIEEQKIILTNKPCECLLNT
jgi:hypothetical protein